MASIRDQLMALLSSYIAFRLRLCFYEQASAKSAKPNDLSIFFRSAFYLPVFARIQALPMRRGSAA